MASVGYRASIGKIGQSGEYDPPTNDKTMYPDLIVYRSRSDTDYNLINNRCFVTVNGLIQNTVIDDTPGAPKGVVVPNGTNILLRSKELHLGLLNFTKAHHSTNKLQLTPELITGVPNTPLYEKAYISMPVIPNTVEREVLGTYMLVIAGYLFLDDGDVVKGINSSTLVLKTDRINLIEKIYELDKQVDIFGLLGLPRRSEAENVLDPSDITDEVIVKLLTLPNSMIVRFPGNNITNEKVYLEHSNVAGHFRTDFEPIYPIRNSKGKLTEYSYKNGPEGKYLVNIADPYYENYLFHYENTSNINSYNTARNPQITHRLTNAFFWKIDIV